MQTGIRLDHRLLAQMEATFGTVDPQTLLCHAHDCETASFFELLFFPGMVAKTDYESQWGDQRLPSPMVDRLVEALSARPLTAVIAVSGRDTPIVLEVPEFAISGFVRRLRIDWQPPPALDDLCRNLGRTSAALRARVLVRHARVRWHPNQTDLVKLLFNQIPLSADDFEAVLSFTLSLLPELAPDADPYAYLVDRKGLYFQSLGKAEAFERYRQANNMEILMLQGARAAHGSIDHWRQLMARIDRICIALFGRSHYFQPPETDSRTMILDNPSDPSGGTQR